MIHADTFTGWTKDQIAEWNNEALAAFIDMLQSRETQPRKPASRRVIKAAESSKRRRNPTGETALRAARTASPAGERARAYIKSCEERPDPTTLAKQFGLSRLHCSELIRRYWGMKYSKQQTGNIAQARAWVATLTVRPKQMDVVGKFHMGRATASRIIAEKFGTTTQARTKAAVSVTEVQA